MQNIKNKISAYLGFDIDGEKRRLLLSKNQIFDTKIFLPFNHAHSVEFAGMECEHLSGFFYSNPAYNYRDNLVTFCVGGEDFVDKIASIINELQGIEEKRQKFLQKNMTENPAIKSKKIEDLSVTYESSSESIASFDREEKRILALLDNYKSFYVV